MLVDILVEFLKGFGIFVGYYAGAVSLLLMFRRFLNPPKEIVRKAFHLICAMSALVLLYAFETWYLAVAAALTLAVALFPIFTYLDRFPKVMEVLVQRTKGEIRSSLVIVYVMMAVLITLFWGALGPGWKYIVVVSIMAWGFGDAAAALVGKAFGKKHIIHRLVEGSKTREGTIAMYAVSGFAIFVTLLICTSFPWYLCLVGALLVAPICALVELISKRGLDTITVPFATAIPLFLLAVFFNFFGL
ncbi:MAG TPA: phosphatidate cytidylyltransferase [Bacillota bacterium]|jgi:dolichol kinase|nr:phosphatidate cytidylyltransferase [Bacillota bacterium]HOA91030.1 phosphatidate cytidylyltransferase [Bacillota bacterium]